MEYEVTLFIKVEPDSNIFEAYGDDLEDLIEHFTTIMYDQDDIQLTDIEVSSAD